MGAIHSPNGFQPAHLVVQVDHPHFRGADRHPVFGGTVQGFYESVILGKG
jgi:hypothetical protein